jgi:hypothetical protein
MTTLRLDCFQNEFLPIGAQIMHAVVTVSASDTSSPAASAADVGQRSELIIIDTSGSMSGRRLRAAKAATVAAIDCIPDGVRFGLIAGNHRAELAYPTAPPLAVASPQTRNVAKAAVKGLEARGGTAMGYWIELAAKVFGSSAGIRHAILLTDGKNEGQAPEELDAILGSAKGRFVCDCRGVGTDWVVAELRKVATALVGTCDIVAQPEGLAADFSQMMQTALAKQVAEVSLRVWTPQNAEILAFKQMDPPIDMATLRHDTEPRVGDYPTGSWGDESRDYFISVRVPPGEIDDEILAARISLIVGGEVVGQGMVRAVWTDDVAKSTQMNRRVATAMNAEELADAIQDVVDSMRLDDIDSATNRAEKVYELAKDAGNQDVLDRVSNLFDFDEQTGRARPKSTVEKEAVMDFEVKSTRTTSRSAPKHSEVIET